MINDRSFNCLYKVILFIHMLVLPVLAIGFDAFSPIVHNTTIENAVRFHRKRIHLKTLFRVEKFENTYRSVVVWTAKTEAFESADVIHITNIAGASVCRMRR